MAWIREPLARLLVRLAASVDPKLTEQLRPIWRPEK